MCLVSIPHRYAENLSELNTRTAKSYVSIPHRYAENKHYLSPPAMRITAVSIPHRYAENRGVED